MNANTFDSHSPTCPICHRNGAIKPHKLLRGLLTCEYCRERLVVSWSGHYVRDPFVFKPVLAGRSLRRASNPLARVYRDFGFTRNPIVLTLLGSALFLGATLLTWQGSPLRQPAEPPQPTPTASLSQPKPPIQ